MNGDLNLSRTLGGLRITNPDDSLPIESAAQTPEFSGLQHPDPRKISTSSPSLVPGDPGRSALATGGQPQLSFQTGRYPSPQPGSRSYPDVAPDDGDDDYRTAPPFSPPRFPTSRGTAENVADHTGSTGPGRETFTGPRMTPNNPQSQNVAYPNGGSFSESNFHEDRPSVQRQGSVGVSYSRVVDPRRPLETTYQCPRLDSTPHLGTEERKDHPGAVSTRQDANTNGKPAPKAVKKGVGDFSFGRILGEGSYSTVFLATDRQTLKEYAIKVLNKKHIIKEKKIKYVNIEKNSLNRLTEHPGIVRLYYTFQDEASLYYVLDLCTGGELLGALKKSGTFDEPCTRFYGAQILDAVEYIHSCGVIHRDLKPENLLLDDEMHIKITDFGTAKLLTDPDPKAPTTSDTNTAVALSMMGEDTSRAASFVGTAEYVSPELLTNKCACKASDLWAFGCVIYQLLAGRPPFKAATEYLTFQKIVSLDYDFPPGFPPVARDLVERCLVLDPSRRLTVEHIRNHAFFDGQQIGRLLWQSNPPRLRPRDHQAMETSAGLKAYNANAPPTLAKSSAPVVGSSIRPVKIVTELPPPSQLDIEWSPVLTRSNERILKLGDLMVISSPLPSSPQGKHSDHGEGHRRLSRFFGGTTKKRQRLVMVTSCGRLLLVASGGADKRTKQDISLLGKDALWRVQTDVKGQVVWCVDSAGTHYSFEEPKSTVTTDLASSLAEAWIESIEKAKEIALSQVVDESYVGENGVSEMPSAVSSPANTLAGTVKSEGFGTPEKGSRAQPANSYVLGEELVSRRGRFIKRQSKTSMGSAF